MEGIEDNSSIDIRYGMKAVASWKRGLAWADARVYMLIVTGAD